MIREQAFLMNMVIFTVVTVTIVTITGFANFGIAQGQVNGTSSSTTADQSPLYEQGYAKGVSDAKLVQSSSPASTTMSPDDVDCNSDIDPQSSNEEYCSGYQHGFADTNNNALSGK